MRGIAILFLSFLLLVGNTAIAVDLHAEALNGQHHPESTPDNKHPDKTTQAASHHCCHGQAHFLSVPTESRFNGLIATGHDWAILSTIRPEHPGHAPPTPPPISLS
ncbi:hypothetical protein [Thiohalophilus sp.]|uniref:hypothetical protein n=1 Tax=Thiohalophilus sp. TaxID=3028392 RepID=UPI002ACDF99C|nr:hypothetical protein [Thiohalophilus sp.]MDZ7662992.1 hypothetical protein [Thiohalophilus sp.]MDZ7804146.1 hypothetical protein [Thiohalophilus sp.]